MTKRFLHTRSIVFIFTPDGWPSLWYMGQNVSSLTIKTQMTLSTSPLLAYVVERDVGEGKNEWWQALWQSRGLQVSASSKAKQQQELNHSVYHTIFFFSRKIHSERIYIERILPRAQLITVQCKEAAFVSGLYLIKKIRLEWGTHNGG